jgi:DNA-directed RNA polymerase specialized sigma24 family protein
MFGRKENRESQFATCKDFQKIFTEEMSSLHLLALLLTADELKAEECFVSGLEDSIQGNPVFRQWARSWSKRAIIKNAIKALAPAVAANGAGHGDGPELNEIKAVAAANFKSGDAQKDSTLAAVLELDTLSRVVFVMAVLENYSERESATLLGCTVHDVVAAKAHAIRYVASRQLAATPETKGFRIPKLSMLTGDAA